ncbi:hypothetical protein GGS24DRAFT_18569 [Hypoxylon argillaceum]|nr:hypothetical protein GGS24DRAFT_18569 [Hypoxylon argillaceum]
MQNDLKQGTPLSPHLYTRVASLSEQLINRPEAQEWALRDLKFLIYDDTDVRVNGYDSDDEEGMMDYAMKMSMDPTITSMEEDKNHEISPRSVIRDVSNEAGPSIVRRKHEDENPNVENSECRVCSSCPEFPHNHKTRKFRLFKPFDAVQRSTPAKDLKAGDVCTHYVAVSYCWPAPEQDEEASAETRSTYHVRELDGTTRRCRALDDVLDRAVDVANTCGLRMIWIDQECLPQPQENSHDDEKHEQQLGVQAMDIIYHRAIVTAGLHDGIITNPLQMDAVRSLMEMDWPTGQPQVNEGFLNHILDFLDTVNRDRWYTRAWVAQEALSAGSGLIIVLRRGNGVSFSSRLRMKGDRYKSPKHTLDHTPRKTPSETICIPVDEFQRLIQAAKRLLERNFFLVDQALCRFNDRSPTLIERAGPILDTAKTLHPRLAIAPGHRGPISIVGGFSYGHRRTVDAAGALSLLNTRECRDQEDRVAIFANMCGYDMRLDTRAVAGNGSLREGLLTLALLNGDLSFLVPEAYPSAEIETFHGGDNTLESGYSWMFPFDRYPTRIDHTSIRNFNLHKFSVPPRLTERGVSLPSYIWQVDDEIDLSPIKYQWEEMWEEIKCLKVTFAPNREKETPEQYATRHNSIATHFSKREILRQTKKDLFLKTELPPTSKAWDGIGNDGIRVTQSVVARRVQEVPEMQRIITEIIFAILRYLSNSAVTDSRARGLATSIWQSLRVDSVDDRMDLPDEVGEELFDHPSVIENPFRTLQLDIGPGGEYSQLWFIDQIMRHGTLWVGRYHRISPHQEVSVYPPTQAVEQTEPQRESGEQETEEVDDTTALIPSKGKAPMDIGTSKSKEPERRTYTNLILQRQMRRTMMAELMAAHGESHRNIIPATITSFAEIVSTGLWSAESEDRRIRDLVSTFDVGGPCMILTPYNADWEMLPRPDLRSMSTCWVIEPVDSDDPKPSASPSTPPQSATNELLESEGDIKQASTSSLGESEEMVREGSTPASDTEQVYRVLGKVRGLWRLMDPPSQRITIV